MTESLSGFDQAGLRGILGGFFLDKYLEVSPPLAETSVETGRIALWAALVPWLVKNP